MRKRWSAILLFCGILSVNASALDGPEIYRRLLLSTVWIKASTIGPTASGVIIARHAMGNRLLILTNFHVVKTTDEIGMRPRVYVHFPEMRMDRSTRESVPVNDRNDEVYQIQKAFKADVTFVDPALDLALLEIDEDSEEYRLGGKKIDPPFLPVAFEKGHLPNLKKVYTVGNPGVSGGLWASTEGVISNTFTDAEVFRRENNETYQAVILETQNPINKGDSGSGVVNEEGRLVGLVKSFTPYRAHTDGEAVIIDEARLKSQAIHVQTLRNFLQAAGTEFARLTYEEPKSATPLRWTDHEARAKYFERTHRERAALYEYQRALSLLLAESGRFAGSAPEGSSRLGQKITSLMAAFKEPQWVKKVRVRNLTRSEVTLRFEAETKNGDNFTWGIPYQLNVKPSHEMVLQVPARRIRYEASREGRVFDGDLSRVIDLVPTEYFLNETLEPQIHTIEWKD